MAVITYEYSCADPEGGGGSGDTGQIKCFNKLIAPLDTGQIKCSNKLIAPLDTDQI